MDNKPMQMMLRVPDNLVTTIRKLVREGRQEDRNASIVQITPEEQADFFQFTVNGWSYPALLENLPTVIEALKTFDRKIFLKSGDIGQVLTVFNNASERTAASTRSCKSITGERVQANGLTPPTVGIVKKRFEKTRKKSGVSVPLIRLVVEDISANWVAASVLNQRDATDGDVQRGAQAAVGAVAATGATKSKRGGSKARGRGVVFEDQMAILHIVEEEIVDFEDWMVSSAQPDGISVSISGKDCQWVKDPRHAIILQHPEILSGNDEFTLQLNNDEMEKEQKSNSKMVLKLQLSNKDKTVDSSAAQSNASANGSAPPGNNNDDDGDDFKIFEADDDVEVGNEDANENPEDIDEDIEGKHAADNAVADTFEENENDIHGENEGKNDRGSELRGVDDGDDLAAYFQVSDSDESEEDEDCDGDDNAGEDIDTTGWVDDEVGEDAVVEQNMADEDNDDDVGLQMDVE